MELPDQAQYMKDRFGGEFVLKTFVNNNVDNTWMFKSGDVVLLVDEGFRDISVQLGGSSHATRITGDVRSQKRSIDYNRPTSGDVSEINKAKKKALEEYFKRGETLYEAWVNSFGEDSVRSDKR
jgi:hypothetical protein